MNNIIEKIANYHFYSDCRACGRSAVLSFKEKSCVNAKCDFLSHFCCYKV